MPSNPAMVSWKPAISEVKPDKYVDPDDKKNGNVEFVSYRLDDKSGDYYNAVYYSVNYDNKIFRQIYKEDWYGEGEPIDGDPESYLNDYNSLDIDSLYKDIIDRFSYVMREKYGIMISEEL